MIRKFIDRFRKKQEPSMDMVQRRSNPIYVNNRNLDYKICKITVKTPSN